MKMSSTAGSLNVDTCRLWIGAVFICLMGGTVQSILIVERGDNITLQCPYKTNAQSVTWQVIRSNTPTNLSPCSMSTGNCTNLIPDIYEADFLSTSVLTLNITGVRLNETNFRCVADDGTVTGNTTLEVYVWPKVGTSLIAENATIFHIAVNITEYYPELIVNMSRRQLPLTSQDNLQQYCNYISYITSSGSREAAICHWYLPITRMPPVYSFVVLVSSRVSDPAQINKKPVAAMDFSGTISLPRIEIYDCTHPIQLKPDGNLSYSASIFNYTEVDYRYTADLDSNIRTSTCSCSLRGSFQVGYYVQWFRQDGKALAPGGDVSKLTIVYDKSDPTPVYECRAMVDSQAFLYAFKQLRPIFFAAPVVKSDAGGSCRVVKTYDSLRYNIKIQNGTTSNCTCAPNSESPTTERARWYTNGTVVGVENPVTRSSTLSLSWETTDESTSYECRIEGSRGSFSGGVLYDPIFAFSSASGWNKQGALVLILSLVYLLQLL